MAVISDESIEDMANANLHVIRFLGLDLEDDVRDSFGTFPFQDTPDGCTSLGRLAGTDQPANTGTPGNSNKRLCLH
ncbi:MAG: transposase [Nitrosomonas sp.]|nr:transposase [Nitrosomonas sp.]